MTKIDELEQEVFNLKFVLIITVIIMLVGFFVLGIYVSKEIKNTESSIETRLERIRYDLKDQDVSSQQKVLTAIADLKNDLYEAGLTCRNKKIVLEEGLLEKKGDSVFTPSTEGHEMASKNPGIITHVELGDAKYIIFTEACLKKGEKYVPKFEKIEVTQ